jgi:hypothetical protein
MLRLFARCHGPFPKHKPGASPTAGRELAEILKAALVGEGLAVSAIAESEYDCTFGCELAKRRYPVSVSLDLDDGDWWEIVVKPALKWPARLLGQDESAELGTLVQAIDRALRSQTGVRDVRWYSRGFEDAERYYAASPTAPLDTATTPRFWALTPLKRFERVARVGERVLPVVFIVAVLLAISPTTRPFAGRVFVATIGTFVGLLGAAMLVGCYARFGSWPHPRRWGDIALFALWACMGLVLATMAGWAFAVVLR